MAGEDSLPEPSMENEVNAEISPGSVEPNTPPPLEEPRKSFESEILERVNDLARLFEGKLAYDEFKESQITHLHKELQEYRADLLARAAMPLIQGIIRLHDDLGKLLEAAARDGSNLSPERFIRSIDAFREDLEELLADNGVSTYQAPGGLFDPHRQRALRTIPAADPSLAGRVAERLRPGFERGNGIVMKERVAVYVARPAEATGRSDQSEDRPALPRGEQES